MLTAALAALSLLLVVIGAAAVLLWRSAVLRITDLEALLRNRVAELDALSIAPPAAAAALTPDAEPPIPAAWLADLYAQPTTHDREYPRWTS